MTDAPNIQSENNRFVRFILKESENAVMHYCMYNLNLSISASARIHLIDNVIESYKSIIFFFKLSQKKETILNYIGDIRRFDKKRRQILTGMCKTGWSEKGLANEQFYFALSFIMEALEVINGKHAEMGSFEKKHTEVWDYKTKQEPKLLLNAVTFFKFIISLIGLCRLLHPLAGITNGLKGCGVDIIGVYDDVSSMIKDIKSKRENIHKEFSVILNKLNK